MPVSELHTEVSYTNTDSKVVKSNHDHKANIIIKKGTDKWLYLLKHSEKYS